MAFKSNRTASQAISDGEFAKFRDFFYRKTGIRFEKNKRYFVDKRILARMEATGHDSFRSYFTFMRFQASGEELQQLTNLMTVNETYFFREEYQFKCLVGPVLAELARHRPLNRPIRIWSIPSSTGEEPYSIAIYLLEYWPKIEEYDVELYASDIDSNVISRCRKGVFSARSVQYLPKAILEKYFRPLPDNQYQICDDLRESVEFSRVNISDSVEMRRFRDIDCIFCRNLLIYFDDFSRRQAVEALYDALVPGGFIFLGHSESMSRISSLFRVRRFPTAICYQKPAA